ncbi:hypothetical protein PsYK624_108020 [Phanerochaete sordida]|uniref:DUF7702 domain-containing protein n=1 Tax=Phanerochaete sordida TaxID=48140 RepID=A0A9P3LGJ7_9APHY|nr:hypothetical protein PsYK624_108020 [Phanerochaete sordida]
MAGINYARYEGIEKSELAGAIVMAVIYVPLFLLNVVRSIRHPTYVLIVLSLFCVIRITAFTLRAILAGSDTAGENINVYIAESVIYSVGFFGLLYSAYTLVLDRIDMLRVRPMISDGPLGIVMRVIGNRRIIRLVLTVAVALGIAAGSMTNSSKQSTLNTAASLRKASVYIFLVVCACLVLVAGQLTVEEMMSRRSVDGPVGRKYRIFVLLAIALLCLLRESFYAATLSNLSQQNNAHLWYPLSALPELLAVLFFAAPGLVPSRLEIAEAEQQKMLGSPDSNEMGHYRK